MQVFSESRDDNNITSLQDVSSLVTRNRALLWSLYAQPLEKIFTRCRYSMLLNKTGKSGKVINKIFMCLGLYP